MGQVKSVAELRAAERTMIIVRWCAVPFALLQVQTFYMPYPDNLHGLGLALVATIAAVNVVLTALYLRVRAPRAVRALAATSMGFDFLAVFGFVWLYTFDVETAMFAMLYLLPLEGAIRYGLRGAIGVMVLATVVYAAREWAGSQWYGHPFLWMSISFRMGIGFLIAAVAGAMAERFQREHSRVESLYQRERDAAEALRAMDDIKNTFLSAVSHELRTPLTSILGFAMTLQDRGQQLDDRGREMLGYLVDEASRLDDLLDDLLDLDRLSRGRVGTTPRRVDLAELLAHVAAAVSQRFDRPVQVRSEPSFACVDERQVERIIENLLGNAIKYSPSESPVEARVRPDADGVLLTVEDAGPGVPRELRSQIFEPFQRGAQTSAHSPGTGIGLSLVQRFAALHGGRAWVEPSTSGGAVFCVYLPAGDGPARETEAPQSDQRAQ